jgi:hypothetical protein
LIVDLDRVAERIAELHVAAARGKELAGIGDGPVIDRDQRTAPDRCNERGRFVGDIRLGERDFAAAPRLDYSIRHIVDGRFEESDAAAVLADDFAGIEEFNAAQLVAEENLRVAADGSDYAALLVRDLRILK